MTSYRSHPDDEWVDVTVFGAAESEYILGRCVGETEVAHARAGYVEGRLSIEDFEAVLDKWLIVSDRNLRLAQPPLSGVLLR
jgi:hypothetical protein